MKFAELGRYREADIAEEIWGVAFEAGEEVEDEGAEGWEVIGEAVEVQHVLFEPAPELLDGVEPGGVGREWDELDREAEAFGPGAGLGRPGARAEEGEGRGLRLQGGEDIGMEVDRPVVEDQGDAAAWVGV